MVRTRKQVKTGWFIVIITIVSVIATFLYGFIATFFVAFVMYDENYHIYDIIFPYLIVFICCLFPLPIAIYAHINKRNIEKYFHLLYMIFAPLFIYLPFILCIPLLFVLRNCYLWYRNKKLNKLQVVEKDLEVSTKAIGEFTTQVNHSKDLINNEEVSNLEKLLGFIQCALVGALVGAIVGALVGATKCAIVGAIVGASARFFANFILNFL